MKSADEIYAEMVGVFREKTGRTPADGGDMAVRLLAAAAQIESLYVYADWVKGQCFPQTAAGEYLDRHAEMRGLSRNAAAAASGTIRFSIAEAAPAAVAVPAGTVCMTARGTEFATTEDAVIPAGSLTCEAAAAASAAGASGNAEAGTIAYMTSPPVGVAGCTNPAAFSGGADAEDDGALRARVLASFNKLPNGANAAYYEKTALAVPGVAAAAVTPKKRGLGTVDVAISAESGMPAAGLVAAVQAKLAAAREICVDVAVSAPAAVTVDVAASVDAENGYAFADVSAAVTAALRAYFGGTLLGRSITRAKLGSIIYGVEGVRNYTLTAPAADVSAGSGELPVLGTATINAWS